MFTGIIEEIGKIARIEPIQGGKRFRVSCSKILEDIKHGDSICINGVCLTVVSFSDSLFICEAVGATLKKTTFDTIGTNENVNLERSLKLSDRLGGHIVQGHVNDVGIIKKITRLGENYFLEINVEGPLNKYLIEEGSIAIDGISLTIASLNQNVVGISVVPFTWANTNLRFKQNGSTVNIETDILGRYVEKLLFDKEKSKNTFSEKWFKDLGY